MVLRGTDGMSAVSKLAVVLVLASCSEPTQGLLGSSPPADAGSSPPDAGRPPAVEVTPDAGARPRRPGCTDDGWCWSLRTPQGLTLEAVWGTGPNNVLAVGYGGTILAWDGTSWSTSPSGTEANLRALWGSGPDDVWAVGDEGTIVHFDGAAWSRVESGTTQPLRAIWGSGRGDVWVAGSDYSGASTPVMRYNGARWSLVPLPFIGAEPVRHVTSIGGTSATDVWVVARSVGFGNTAILRWDGLTWSVTGEWAAHTSPEPVAILAHAPTDVVAVGRAGSRGVDNVLRWDGSEWSAEPSGARALLASWASSAQDVWAAGGESTGVLQRWNGGTWSAVPGVDAPGLRSVWGSGPNDVFAVGVAGTILHWDGAQITEMSRGPVVSGDTILEGGPRALWVAGPQDIWAAGRGAILRWQGAVSSWTVIPINPVSVIEGVWGSGPDDIWAAGFDSGMFRRAKMLRWNGSAWLDVPLQLTEAQELHAIWGSDSNDAFAVGSEQRIGDQRPMILRWDGVAWSKMDAGSAPTLRHGRLSAVWGSGPSDVWAAGAASAGGTDEELIMRWNGTVWSAVASGLPPPPVNGSRRIEALWGSGEDDVWAVGVVREPGVDRALVLRWNGTAWSEHASASMPGLDAVWGRGPRDVVVAGLGGTIWRWNGDAWSSTLSGVPEGMVQAVAGTSAGDLWAVGILKWDWVGDWFILRRE